MSILVCNTQNEVDLIPEPKHIWHDVNRIVVYTGIDIPVISKVINVTDFRSRFTNSEMMAILQLAYSGAGDVSAMEILLKLQTGSEIDLDDPKVVAGMNYWVSKNIITQDRANQILS